MVATENEEILWIFDLVCQEQAYCLKRLLASIHVIAQEEVVCLGWEAAVLEQAQKIVVLAVDIATDLGGELESNRPRWREQAYLDGSFEFEQYGLRNKDLASLRAKMTNLCF
jgi:hypothetical protein